MKRQDVIREAGKITAVDRNAAYGDPEDNFQNIADIWNAQGVRINGREVDSSDVALLMIGMKLARLKHNPSHEDSWVDIAGYAACGAETADVAEECPCDEEFKAKEGVLYVAPLGTEAGTWPEGWKEVGYTTEGFSETLSADVDDLSDVAKSIINNGASVQLQMDLDTVKRVAAKHSAKPKPACGVENPHAAHNISSGARGFDAMHGLTWCEGVV